MKKTLIFLFLFLLSLTVSAQKKKSDAESERLKGNVKSITVETASLKTKEEKSTDGQNVLNIIEEPRKLISIEEYDANGNLTKDERYNKEELIYRTLYFDLDEYRASKTEDFFKGVGGGGPGKPCDKPDNRYTFKSKYEYDKQGNRIKEEQYGNCNTLSSKLIYEYDSQGFLLELVS